MDMILSCTTFSTSLALRSARYKASALTPLGASTTRPFGRRPCLLLLLLLLLCTAAMPTDATPTVLLSASLPSLPLMWKGIGGASAVAADAVATEAMPMLAAPVVAAAAAALRASLLDTWRCNLCETAAKAHHQQQMLVNSQLICGLQQRDTNTLQMLLSFAGCSCAGCGAKLVCCC
jgi:hypothetical protein